MGTRIKNSPLGLPQRNVYFNGEYVASINKMSSSQAEDADCQATPWVLLYYGGRYHGRVERFATLAETRAAARKITGE